ncbi:hypothetical protein CBOM_05362 [Ceraceosorus bombacis]|uniref:RxLR-like protein n=1 Tax=Ceraceosorus bombacis TaxID=401625 RepID=A0A0P1BRQ2_9BASI|nr:hypothetical protein CBOM_05362 [Ceraceosorus bombacis]
MRGPFIALCLIASISSRSVQGQPIAGNELRARAPPDPTQSEKTSASGTSWDRPAKIQKVSAPHGQDVQDVQRKTDRRLARAKAREAAAVHWSYLDDVDRASTSLTATTPVRTWNKSPVGASSSPLRSNARWQHTIRQFKTTPHLALRKSVSPSRSSFLSGYSASGSEAGKPRNKGTATTSTSSTSTSTSAGELAHDAESALKKGMGHVLM